LQNGDLESGSTDTTIKICDVSAGLLKRAFTVHTGFISIIINGSFASGSH